MAGKRRSVSKRGHKAIERAVDEAENTTGLQFCVYLGSVVGDPRGHAEDLFVKAGLPARPAVLVVVAPEDRRVEVVTSSEARERVDDEACATAVADMTERFKNGDIAAGIVAGLHRLTAVAGPGVAPADQEELPDVVED